MSMKYDIEIEQGETFVFGLRLRDPQGNNAFASATSAESQIRETPDSPVVMAEFECTFSSNNDTLWLKLSPALTQPLSGTGRYDVKVFWPDREDYIVNGKVKILPRVTR